MAHVEVLVEEPSAQAALDELLPRLLGDENSWSVHAHQGKRDLLQKLPSRLKGYASLLRSDPKLRVVVLIDRDREDCRRLKKKLERLAADAGLVTKTANPSHCTALTRIAIEELEAWFFGDIAALRGAYPKVPRTLPEKARYRDPDAIHDTWETLERMLQESGYHSAGLPKIAVAREVARRMRPDANRSTSFRSFCEGLIVVAR